MTGNPQINYIGQPTRKQGEGKTWWEACLKVLKEHGFLKKAETLAADIFALSDEYRYYVLSGQGAAADDCKAITPTNARDGDIVICAIASTSQPITFKHNISVASKLKNSDDADVIMTRLQDRICYRYDATDDIWYELWRNTGGMGRWTFSAQNGNFNNSGPSGTFYEIDTTGGAVVVTMLDTAPLGTEHIMARTAGANQITFNRSGTNNLFVLGQTLTTIAYSDDSTIRWIKRSGGWHVS